MIHSTVRQSRSRPLRTVDQLCSPREDDRLAALSSWALKDWLIFALHICWIDITNEWTGGHCSVLVWDLEIGGETELINYCQCIFWPVHLTVWSSNESPNSFHSHTPPSAVIHFDLECIRDCKSVWNSSQWNTLIIRNVFLLSSLKNTLNKWYQKMAQRSSPSEGKVHFFPNDISSYVKNLSMSGSLTEDLTVWQKQ